MLVFYDEPIRLFFFYIMTKYFQIISNSSNPYEHISFFWLLNLGIEISLKLVII